MREHPLPLNITTEGAVTMSNSIYSCSICETPTKTNSGKCRSCAAKQGHQRKGRREQLRERMMGNTLSCGRPKGSKNKHPYIRDIDTYYRGSRPYNRDPVKIAKCQRAWINKTDGEIVTMMEKQNKSKIENGTLVMTRTYHGRYKVKNPKKYKGDHTSVQYRSHWEKNVMMHLDGNTKVVSWSSEEIVVPYRYDVDGRVHRYFVDFFIEYSNGTKLLIEIKPFKETKPPTGNRRTKRYITEGFTYIKNQNKWEAAAEYAADRGWDFQIWTEKELEKMGILPKSMKPLKPFTKKKNK